jgi:two-component system, OmpR family, alkaline phosphatase synthesis response regulator PhoP
MATKILVVDDEPYMHRLLQHHLGRAGFQMLDAVNGRQAVEIAQREAPGLIVMDVMMAEMDGLSALKQLKKDDATKAIPVIMITASAHHITRQEAEHSGAALFLTKPFSPTKLLMAVRDLVPEAQRA